MLGKFNNQRSGKIQEDKLLKRTDHKMEIVVKQLYLLLGINCQV